MPSAGGWGRGSSPAPNRCCSTPSISSGPARFYERHGSKTIVIARFVPIIRTFAPVVAGVGQMEYRRFLFYNVAGGVGWVTSMTWAGYLLGAAVPNIGDHIHIVVGVVIVLSLIPIVVELIRERRRRSA